MTGFLHGAQRSWGSTRLMAESALPFYGGIQLCWKARAHLFMLSLVGRHLGCSHLLSPVNNAAVNNHVQVFNYCFHVFGVHAPRSTRAQSNGISVLHFKDPPNSFPRGCTITHTHQQCTALPTLRILDNISYLPSFLLYPPWWV